MSVVTHGALQTLTLALAHNASRRAAAKIRRLYDVANVLVSVGLIEKLQLSNSRKPVFRWRNRSLSEAQETNSIGRAASVVKTETSFIAPVAAVAARPKDVATASSAAANAPAPASIDLECEEESDALKTSQSCESDSSDDHSDAQSDCSASSATKRKFRDSRQASAPATATSAASDSDRSDAVTKRSKTDATAPSSSAVAVVSVPTPSVIATSTPPPTLLRFDTHDAPVHPQVILHEQQERVRAYMQQYIREYVHHVVLQQAPLCASSAAIGASTAVGATETSPDTSASVESSVATITQSIHSTPVTMPSLTNRVTSDLAGSLHDLLFSATATTSPQSVADLLTTETRLAASSVPSVLVSPPRPPLAPEKAPSASKATATVVVDVHEQPRKLLDELQSTTTTTPQV